MDTNHTLNQAIVLAVYSRLDQAFPDREELTQKEAARFLGIHEDTVSRYLSKTADGKISKATLVKHLITTRG